MRKNVLSVLTLVTLALLSLKTFGQTKQPATKAAVKPATAPAATKSSSQQYTATKTAVAPKPIDPRDTVAVANLKFTEGNFDEALGAYLKLLEKDEKNVLYNFRIGVCYLETNFDKVKAKPFLEYASGQPNVDKKVLYYLAKSYAYNNEFDQAIDLYKKYLDTPAAVNQSKSIQHEIEMCQNAKELIKFPVSVTFENLGTNINTPFADYSPFISTDETFLMFNSQRPDNSVKKSNGRYAANVYISEVKEGKWQDAQDIGELVNSTAGDEEIVGVCADGNTLIFNIGKQGVGDIFVGPKYGNSVLKPFKVNPNINNAKSIESAASISPDGRTLYFASDRPGGLGGYDIYRTRILPDGEWGEAYNLGPDVNTPYDEDFPNISLDGYTLYYSSKGHNSMGGYDIFKSEMLPDSLNFGPSKNIGYPVNTAFDDRNLCMSGKGRYGYMATTRKGGFGDLDIYRVIFNGVDAELTVVKGVLKEGKTDKIPQNASVEVFESKSNVTFGNYKVNSSTGKYVIILPPGKYYVEVSAKGYKTHSEDIIILDKGSFVPSIERNFSLLPE